MAKHKHCELIHAWADGAEIECYHEPTNAWAPTNNPTWGDNRKYRIKPKEPYWFESIPEHGVLCWVSDINSNPDKNSLTAIVTYKSSVYHIHRSSTRKYATPLTDDEIKQFLRGEQ